MSRTYRNKSKVPYGLVVRDDGRIYFKGSGKHLQERRRGRINTPRFRRHWANKEKKYARKSTYRSYRYRSRALLKAGQWEKIVPFQRTCGWITW